MYLFYVLLADFQADVRLTIVNESVKRAKRGSARLAEQDFRTRELMPSNPFAESRFARNFNNLSSAKDTEYRSSWL